MTTPYLHSDHFPNSSPAAAAQLAEDLEHLLAADYRGDLYAMLAGWQRVLADNRKRRQWPELHRKLATLFRCGRTAVVDGPMIGFRCPSATATTSARQPVFSAGSGRWRPRWSGWPPPGT